MVELWIDQFSSQCRAIQLDHRDVAFEGEVCGCLRKQGRTEKLYARAGKCFMTRVVTSVSTTIIVAMMVRMAGFQAQRFKRLPF
jgi:hypothetical protein